MIWHYINSNGLYFTKLKQTNIIITDEQQEITMKLRVINVIENIITLGTNIYIYCHPQTDCFVLSELLSVTRSRDRYPSNFTID